jgi:L-ascorbate metabolism protein UlaG (beta-lactamase superfamily)
VLRDRIGPLVRVAPMAAWDGAGALDAILLSHLHYDHADLPSLVRLDAPVLAPRGAAAWLEARGVRRVRELGRAERTSVGSLRVIATHAVHHGRRRPFGVGAPPIGFVVQGSQSVYFAGDTDLFPGMARLGPIDLALLPVAGWGPTLGPGHLDPERAARAAARIAPRVAVPIHWGTIAPWPRALRPGDPERPAREFAALVARHAPEVEVRLLAPGDSTEIGAPIPAAAR